MPPPRITESEIAVLKTLRLSEPLVQMLLTGFFRAELREMHGVDLNLSDVHNALVRFVEAIEEGTFDEMIRLQGGPDARR